VAASVLFTLLALEVGARLIVSIGSPPEFYSADFDKKYALAKSLSPKDGHSIILLGTSRTQRGIYPELVASELNRLGCESSVINLATYGSLPQDEKFLCETAFESGFTPSMITYDVGPEDVLYRAGKAGFSAEFANSPSGSAFLREKTSLLGQLRRLIDQNLYLISHRQFFKSIVTTIPERLLKPLDAYATGPVGVGAEGSPLGWAPGYRMLTTAQCNEQIDEYCGSIPPPAFDFASPVIAHQKYLSPIIDLCRERKIPLVLLWLPRPGHSLDLCDKFLAKFSIKSSELIHETANGSKALLIDLHTDDENGHYSDVTHLSVVGSVKASYELARQLAVKPFRDILARCEAK
jgi:hypothetical protein